MQNQTDLETEALAEVTTNTATEEAPAEVTTNTATEEAPAEVTTNTATEEAPAEGTNTATATEEAPAEVTTNTVTDEAPAEVTTNTATEEAPAEVTTNTATEEAPAEVTTNTATEEDTAEVTDTATATATEEAPAETNTAPEFKADDLTIAATGTLSPVLEEVESEPAVTQLSDGETSHEGDNDLDEENDDSSVILRKLLNSMKQSTDRTFITEVCTNNDLRPLLKDFIESAQIALSQEPAPQVSAGDLQRSMMLFSRESSTPVSTSKKDDVVDNSAVQQLDIPSNKM